MSSAAPDAGGAVEIERKFRVSSPPADLEGHPSSDIRQGYLAVTDDGTEVRVRRRDGTAVLTVKKGGGRSRVEEEVPLDPEAFDRLWPLTEGRRVEKVRHVIPVGDLELELDVYSGDLDGLVVAEIEFASEAAADAFEPPDWLGTEVTDDPRFKNQRLALEGVPADEDGAGAA